MIIEVADLQKTFRTRRKAPGVTGSLKALFRPDIVETQAVRGISLQVERGESLAFIGPNGAGKSTTIKMLAGILHPTSGEARVLGFVPWKDRSRLCFRIGSVFGQKSQLWYHLPPLDTFNLLAKIYELDHGKYLARRAQLVELFELEELLHTPVRKLSLGQRMRCEIAASLLHKPEVIFLDEPTIGLDVVAKQTIRDLIKRSNREEGTTIFLTSHDAGDIEQVCKRVVIINHGQVIFDDHVSTLKREFLRSKVIDLKLDTPFRGLDLPGVTVVKARGYGVKLELDTEVQPIDLVVGRILQEYRVLDMTISDPAMESIISLIYRQREGEAVGR